MSNLTQIIHKFFGCVQEDDKDRFWSLIHPEFILWNECLALTGRPPEIAGSLFEYGAFLKIVTELDDPLKQLRKDLASSQHLILNHHFWRKEQFPNYGIKKLV